MAENSQLEPVKLITLEGKLSIETPGTSAALQLLHLSPCLRSAAETASPYTEPY